MNPLERRIIDISFEEKIGHLSSTLNAVNIIDEIYQTKQLDEPFILSSGHAALALYAVLEKYHGLDAIQLFHKHGVHPHRDLDNHIYCSTGSLGLGITVAVGYAMANRDKKVYCLISDGEAAEGSVWESLRYIYEHKLTNCKIYANVNGMMAYDFLDSDYLIRRLQTFLPDINIRRTKVPNWPFANGILTHYYVLKPEDYKLLCETDWDNSLQKL